VLCHRLRADPAGLLVLECRAEIGPVARVLPEVQRRVESERRILAVGSHDCWIEEYDAIRRAAVRDWSRSGRRRSDACVPVS